MHTSCPGACAARSLALISYRLETPPSLSPSLLHPFTETELVRWKSLPFCYSSSSVFTQVEKMKEPTNLSIRPTCSNFTQNRATKHRDWPTWTQCSSLAPSSELGPTFNVFFLTEMKGTLSKERQKFARSAACYYVFIVRCKNYYWCEHEKKKEENYYSYPQQFKYR